MRKRFSLPVTIDAGDTDPFVQQQPASVAIAIPDKTMSVEGIPYPKPLPDLELENEAISAYEGALRSVSSTQTPALISLRLRRAIRDAGLHCYDSNEVVEFLDKKLGGRWEWMPLRYEDKWNVNSRSLGGDLFTETKARNVRISFQIYEGAVPYPVLLTVKTIAKEVQEARFFISGIPRPQGDPFLAVSNGFGDHFIIERWDEPNFRERTPAK